MRGCAGCRGAGCPWRRNRSDAPAAVACATIAVCLALVASPLRSQVSANEELDKCMAEAAVSGAVVGGSVGAAIGSLLGSGLRDRLNKGLGGAAIGATIGGVAGWYTSYRSCVARFATASSLVTEEYESCARKLNYARDGVLVGIDGDSLPERARGGERVDSDVRYHVLTPDPRDVPVELTRRFLCKDDQGRYDELASPVERLTVGAGCHVSRGGFPLPSKIPAELDCRMEVTLQAEGQRVERAGTFRIVP